MLVRKDLPELGTNLVTTLTRLKMDWQTNRVNAVSALTTLPAHQFLSF